ncbi:MAG: hypothetical protein GY787_01715 [Alteromonadales bacterium]|nr:hypothetical protein [Alteromonadales bacterium]
MKYLLLIISLYSCISSACVTGPEIIIPKEEFGFLFKENASNLCDSCSMNTITVPKAYKEVPVSNAIFSVFFDGELVSKSVNDLKIIQMLRYLLVS